MKVVKIKLSEFARLSHMDFVGAAGDIANQLLSHTDVFPGPPVPAAILEGAVQDLAAKTIAAGGDDGSNALRNARDLQKSVVLNYILQISVYVFSIANGKQTVEEKIATIELAGYEVANDSFNPVGELPPVVGFSVKSAGVPGVNTVALKWKRGKGTAFIIQAMQGNPVGQDAEWDEVAISTKSKYTLTLTPGTWSLRVIALGPLGQSEPCQPLSVVIG